jgi:glycosyltransferase involved in cell wall biosynthesis
MSNGPVRVAIEAQIRSGSEGGMEQALIGLCHGLGRLGNESDEYVVVGDWRDPSWLSPYIGRGMRCVTPPTPPGQRLERLKELLGPLRPSFGTLKRAILGQEAVTQKPLLPVSDGFYESLQPDVLHITYPLNFVLARIPTIVTMHDLQHRHFPEFFGSAALAWRESTYPRMFDAAQAIITVSQFCKADIVHQYDIDPGKVFVIPLAPSTSAYRMISKQEAERIIQRYCLPKDFMLYPALTYEHKNHVRLLEAIASLQGRGNQVPVLVCIGRLGHHWQAIEKKISDLRIQNRVRFLGFVQPSEVLALYELARFVVLPTLFEGAGLPLIEAFQASKAVACSDIPAFREYGGSAPLFFDPRDVCSIADAVARMNENDALRATMAAEGFKRVARFTWDRAAECHQAVYRKVAGRGLTGAEMELVCTC